MKPKKSKVDKNLCRIITPEFRVSYPHLFKPQAPKPTDKKKYSITMLFPKDRELSGFIPGREDENGNPVKRSIKKAIKNATIGFYGEDESEWPELISPITDGDSPKFKDKDGYKGHWVIKAITSEDQKPVVVDQKMKPIEDPNDLYPGCYARAHIFAYRWEYMGREGIGFILDHVQKLRDGKSFGGKKDVTEVFSPVDAGDDEDEDEVGDFK